MVNHRKLNLYKTVISPINPRRVIRNTLMECCDYGQCLLVDEDDLDVHIFSVLVEKVGQKTGHRVEGDMATDHNVSEILDTLDRKSVV